jgi:hypothetical protein
VAEESAEDSVEQSVEESVAQPAEEGTPGEMVVKPAWPGPAEAV